jgi:HB1, ASXL, restriction endonuclease HTH domain
MPRMTYYEAALSVLRTTRRPLSTQEITDLALQRKLILPEGKTPHATMSAVLYTQVGDNSELVKIDVPGKRRAKRGSVRWTVRRG